MSIKSAIHITENSLKREKNEHEFSLALTPLGFIPRVIFFCRMNDPKNSDNIIIHYYTTKLSVHK